MVTFLTKSAAGGFAALALTAGLAVTPAAAAHGQHGAAIAGALGGFAAGAIIGGALSGPGYYYGSPAYQGYYGAPAYEGYYAPACGFVQQPVYDQFGYFIGYRNVPAC